MDKTYISEAALASLAASGFAVIKGYIGSGIDGVDAVAFGTFVSGLIILVQRHRMKAAAAKASKKVING